MIDPEPSNPVSGPPLSSAHGTHPHEPMIRRGAFDPPSAPGSLGRLEGFDILRLLGEGGMGQVYLAHESLTQAQVAIKIMKPQTADDPQEVHRFLTEARHMYQLSNPRILRVLKISDRQEGPYYVMPYLEGGNLLTQYKPGQPMPAEKILTVAHQVAEALSHAHAHGLIHRDIKPGNVLLDKEGNAYLTDFGLVRTVFNDSMIDAAASHLEGTAPYMSPAVAGGQAEDTRCDIYAFGALLYELLTGQPPYTGRTPQMILDQILKGPPAPIRSVNTKASPGLVKIAEGCMARELRDRYASMADVMSDISRTAMGKTPLGPHRRKRGLPCSPAWAFGALTTALGIMAVVYLSSLEFSDVAQKTETDSLPASASTRPDFPSLKSLGLVAWWPGDGNADEVIGNRKGESVKGADYGPGIDGQAFRVDGKGQYFRVPHDPLLAFTRGAPFTLEAWVFRTSDSLPFHVMGKRSPVDTNASYYQMGYDPTDQEVPTNVWTHLVVVYPAAETPSKCMVKSYMNGEMTSLQRCNTRIGPNDADLHIGFSGPFGGFAGRIDNLRIYDRELSSDEIKSLHEETAKRIPYYSNSPAHDYTYTAQDYTYTYTVSAGQITITKYIGSGGALVISDKIEGLPVTRIGRNAFSDCTTLARVTLPASVISIACNAFARCGGLNSITVDAANPAYRSDDEGVVFSKDMTTLVCYPSGKSGSYAIPDTVARIDHCAFEGCGKVTEITLPTSVTSIGQYAFKGCQSLTSMTLFSGITCIDLAMFQDCTSLLDVTIPATVTRIRGWGFSNCSSLTSIHFKGNAPSLGKEAFAGTDKATIYYLPGTSGWGSELGGLPTKEWKE